MYIQRPHLIAALDTGHRVKVIKAEGGAGKTTLVTNWLEGLDDGVPVLWITLDAAFRSGRGFWFQVVQAILDKGLASRNGTLSRYLDGEVPFDHAPALIANTINGGRTPVRVVVDDLHLLEQTAYPQLVQLLNHAPRLTFVGITRKDTPLETGADALALDTKVLTSRDFTLSPHEMNELAHQYGLSLPPREVDIIREITRGHMLASRISIASVAREDGIADERLLRSVVVQRVTEAVEQGLVTEFRSPENTVSSHQLALSPMVDAELASALIGSSAAWDLVESFAEHGLGRISVLEGRPVFTFHALIRSALENHSAEVLGTDERARCYRVAAAHLAEWGDPVEVIRLWLCAEEYAPIWPFYGRNFSPLSVKRRDDMIRLFSGIPDEILREHGLLALILAIGLSEREARPSARVKTLARWALRSLDRAEPPRTFVEKMLHLAARFGAYRTIRQYTSTADASEEVQRLFESLSPDELHQVAETAYPVTIQSMITDILDGRLSLSINESSILSGDWNESRQRHRSSLLAYSYALRGEIPSAKRHLAEISEGYPPTWPQAIQAIGWNFGRALVRLEDGDFDGAHAALDPLESRIPFFEHWAMALYTRGLIHLVSGDVSTGLSELRQALHDARGRIASKQMSARVHSLLADLTMASGELQQARSIVSGLPSSTFTHLSAARLSLLTHSPEDALSNVKAAEAPDIKPREAVTARLLAASAYLELGVEEEAHAQVQRACGAMRRFGLTSPLAHVPRDGIAPILEECGCPIPTALGNPFTIVTGERLSQREMVVLRLLPADKSIADIAQDLHVSPNTVKSQMKSIYRKLGVSTRAVAVATAHSRGLL